MPDSLVTGARGRDIQVPLEAMKTLAPLMFGSVFEVVFLIHAAEHDQKENSSFNSKWDIFFFYFQRKRNKVVQEEGDRSGRKADEYIYTTYIYTCMLT